MDQILQTPSDILDRVRKPSFTIVGHGSQGIAPPALPKLKGTPMSHHRHGANPHFVLDVLQGLQGHALQWVEELQDVQRDIQNVYLEGPLVNGWLESAATGQRKETGTVLTPAEMKGGYCLCGLDEFGKLWSKACPMEELPAVSVAIARYHRLKKLLTKKQRIEDKLKGLTKSLEGIYEEHGITAPTESA
ncbi:MAG: hypothetical protein HC799_09715 [Limnothrix sp. RL_2_0]|nr:hypothetical protein [Limnothrix sp. RL_2_0]